MNHSTNYAADDSNLMPSVAPGLGTNYILKNSREIRTKQTRKERKTNVDESLTKFVDAYFDNCVDSEMDRHSREKERRVPPRRTKSADHHGARKSNSAARRGRRPGTKMTVLYPFLNSDDTSVTSAGTLGTTGTSSTANTVRLHRRKRSSTTSPKKTPQTGAGRRGKSRDMRSSTHRPSARSFAPIRGTSNDVAFNPTSGVVRRQSIGHIAPSIATTDVVAPNSDNSLDKAQLEKTSEDYSVRMRMRKLRQDAILDQALDDRRKIEEQKKNLDERLAQHNTEERPIYKARRRGSLSGLKKKVEGLRGHRGEESPKTVVEEKEEMSNRFKVKQRGSLSGRTKAKHRAKDRKERESREAQKPGSDTSRSSKTGNIVREILDMDGLYGEDNLRDSSKGEAEYDASKMASRRKPGTALIELVTDRLDTPEGNKTSYRERHSQIQVPSLVGTNSSWDI